MAYFVFLDVDKTLLLSDENGNHIINQGLLDQLKVYGYLNIYLFTNMSLSDHEQIINTYDMQTSSPDQLIPARISRYELVEQLKKQGFDVMGVITPADAGYQQGIGTAYDDLYVPAYERLQRKIKQGRLNCEEERKSHLARNKKFTNFIPPLPVEYQEMNQRLPGQKYNMLAYFVSDTSKKFTTHILYIDDDRNCLDAVENAHRNTKNSIKLTTIQVLENGELANAAALQHFYSPALAIAMLKQAEAVCGKKQSSVEKFIKQAHESYMIDLKTTRAIVIEFMENCLSRKKDPSAFLVALLSILSGLDVTKDNFHQCWGAFNASSSTAVSSFGIFSVEKTPVASSSSSPSYQPH